MRIFDFFKRRPVKVEAESESVAFDDIKVWIKNKDGDLREDERETIYEIGVKLEEFYVSVEDKLGVLGGVDIESKKEYGRAKILVRQGLDKYIDSVRVLLKNLRAINKDNLNDFVKKVSGAFVLFEKTSARVYERATYLVGNEMVAVRNEIRRFYNEFLKTLENSLVGDLNAVESIRLKLKELEELKNNMGAIEREILENDSMIENAKKSVESLKDEIEKIKNSSKYLSNLKARDEITSLRAGLDNEIGKLKELIDFKRLTNIVHSNERELNVVKDYKAHFSSEFFRDGGEKMLGLLEGSNMKSPKIVAQVDLIEKKSDELDEKSEVIGVDDTIGKLKEIRGVEESIDNMELDIVKRKRRLEDSDLKSKGLGNEIIALVKGFGVSVD